MTVAPSDWAWGLFPLEEDAGERLNLDAVVQEALGRIEEAEWLGDGAPMGPVPHWAHILKTSQNTNGTWPAAVNARTGETIGVALTVAPVLLMARLDALLDSSEYEGCIARTMGTTHQGEADGTRGTVGSPVGGDAQDSQQA